MGKESHAEKAIRKYKPIKQRRGCGCLTFLLTLVLIIVLVVVGIVAYNSYKQHEARKELMEELRSEIFVMDCQQEDAAYIESLKDKPSDIEGMSQYEKLQAGLVPSDGSDSDGDGVTDKDELEKYGSDPLNPCTAGDGIPDGFKVQYGVDVLGKYDEESSVYMGHQCAVNPYKNIVLKNAGESCNSLCHVVEKEGYSMAGIATTKAYKIYDYTGEVSIDFTEYITEGKQYTAFVVGDDMNAEEKAIKLKDGKAEFDLDGFPYTVGIYETPEEGLTANSLVQLQDGGSNSGKDAMIFIAPIGALNGEVPIIIWENNLLLAGSQYTISNSDFAAELGYGNYNTTLQYIYLDPLSYGALNAFMKTFWSYDWLQTAAAKGGTELSEENISAIRQFMQYLVIFYDIEGGNWQAFHDYLDIIGSSSEEESTEETEPKRPSKYVTTYNINKDTFPFNNMGTYISSGGNCAGFAQITVELFNGKPYPASDEGTFDDIHYSYDLTGIEECDTLFDRYLYDYKYRNYWRDTYHRTEIDSEGKEVDYTTANLPKTAYSPEDAAFLDFLGFKWAEANEMGEISFRFNCEKMPWSNFEELLSYFEKNNKILYVTLRYAGSAHAVVAYGVEPDPNDPDTWYVLIDDSNFPGGYITSASTGKTYYADCRMKVVKQKDIFGIPYAEWDYYPLPDLLPDYRYTSQKANWLENMAVWKIVEFSAKDENYNVVLK